MSEFKLLEIAKLRAERAVLEAECERLRAELTAAKGQERVVGFDYSIKTYSANTTTTRSSTTVREVTVPEGWRLVPVEPTVEMLDVAISHALAVSLSRDYNWSAYMRDVWLRMVEVAPQQNRNQHKQR